MRREALHYDYSHDKVICRLCPHNCHLNEGQYGICGSRFRENNDLITNNYGEIISLSMDPIEKKPLYHFYPGSQILSTGANGCNLSCSFCQNYQISNRRVNTKFLSPAELIKTAKNSESIGIAYTYTEPSIWFEYILDSAKIASENNLKNVLITNGFINKTPLLELLPYIDAMNIDLKSFSNDFYKDICGGSLTPVLETIELCAERTHIEITNLLISNENDSIDEIKKLVEFISSISSNIPTHFSKYFPMYQMSQPETSRETMINALRIAREKLNYVYAGNIQINDGSVTKCPDCGNILINRTGYFVEMSNIVNHKCKFCNRTFDGQI